MTLYSDQYNGSRPYRLDLIVTRAARRAGLDAHAGVEMVAV